MGWKIDDGRPIWTQLKEQMIKRIVSGTYSSGEKLPSVTEDVTKIEECRKDIAHKIVKQYIRDLEELGYNKEDAVALIGKEEEE